VKIERRCIAAMALAVLVSACGGGGSDSPSASASHTARALASLEPIGAHCAAGGARIDAGIDSNGNGILDASEIVSTQYVCDGATGASGAIGATGLTGLAGATGPGGAAGLTALVHMSAEAAGPHCANGGTKVDAGADANGNGVLDVAEISAVAYVCDGAAGSAGADGHDTLMSIVAEAAGANCAAGGSRIRSGLDSDRSGSLDSSEVTASRYVCNGSNGAAGSNGSNSLIAIAVEAAGANCAAGGSKVSSGLDSNGNAILDVSEVTATAYICKGAAGANGSNGSNGASGSNGTNGDTTLTVSIAEAAGAHCAAGGIKITSGADTSRDGVLDLAEITATSYVCNGLAAIGWIDVTTLTAQADPNTGYVADNAAQVAITLPASPNVGDVVRVSGAGAGGWLIAQNAGQSIVTTNLDVATIAQNWTSASTPTQNWRAVASSADGNRLVAVAYMGSIVTSADAGVTWSTSSVVRGWNAVASSADGRRLFAAGFGERLYVSGDYGATWAATENGRSWTAVASSSDGRVLAAVALGSQVYVSTDYGSNWTARDTGRDWSSIALSADGSRMIATENGWVFTSADEGVSWNYANLCCANWRSVASSADGRRLVVVGDGVQIYTSDDYGSNWSSRDSNRPWTAVTSSADGSRLVAATRDDGFGSFNGASGSIFFSSDQGATWTQRAAPNDTWNSLASSADGSRWAAVSTQGDGTGSIVTSAPTRATATTTGITGGIVGRQFQAIELQYIGGGTFVVLDAIGTRFDVQ
jgi:photosystem II stability/assembly factor-like uncharacterized protein